MTNEPLILKEINAFLDRHLQHFRDVFPVICDLKGFVIVSRPLAGRTGYFYIGHKVQFRRNLTFTAALLASPTFDVKAESGSGIAARF